jgi:hypothetical protein
MGIVRRAGLNGQGKAAPARVVPLVEGPETRKGRRMAERPSAGFRGQSKGRSPGRENRRGGRSEPSGHTPTRQEPQKGVSGNPTSREVGGPGLASDRGFFELQHTLSRSGTAIGPEERRRGTGPRKEAEETVSTPRGREQKAGCGGSVSRSGRTGQDGRKSSRRRSVGQGPRGEKSQERRPESGRREVKSLPAVSRRERRAREKRHEGERSRNALGSVSSTPDPVHDGRASGASAGWARKPHKGSPNPSGIGRRVSCRRERFHERRVEAGIPYPRTQNATTRWQRFQEARRGKPRSNLRMSQLGGTLKGTNPGSVSSLK